MYRLRSALYAHQDCHLYADAMQRVEAVAAAMGQEPRWYGDEEVADIVASTPWAKLRQTHFGEQANPPDPDVVLTVARWDIAPHRQAILDGIEDGGQRRLAAQMFGLEAFSWFSSGQEDYRKPRPDHVCRPAWRLKTMNGCPHRCAYCHLGAVHFAMVNMEEYGEKLAELIEHNPWESTYLFNDASDTLVLEPEIDQVRFFIDFFRRWPERYFIVHTKSANVDSLLGLDHRRRCIMLFTISGPRSSRLYEPGAPTCEERFAAARRCYEAGYPVRFKFKPIIPIEGWREEAKVQARLALDGMRPEVINLFTLAWMDVDTMKRCFTAAPLDAEIVAAAEAARDELKGSRVAPLPHAVRAMIYDHYINVIRAVDKDVPITFSTETLEMWQQFGPRLGYSARDYICGCGARAVPGLDRLKENPWRVCDPVTWDGQPVPIPS